MRPSLSTTSGDSGFTGLYGGTRVSKASARIQSYGDVDELNAILGVILSESDPPPQLQTQLSEVQRMLFVLGADLATPLDSTSSVTRISEQEIQMVEQWGIRFEKELPALTHFILPSGSRLGCLLHQARTVCRRAERWVVTLADQEQINIHARVYVNRLGDYLFLAARVANREAGVDERQWIP